MNPPPLTMLCVTEGKLWARPFLYGMWTLSKKLGAELILACDGERAYDEVCEFGLPVESLRMVYSQGYIESVLEAAIRFTSGEYILRLDDDERCSQGMARWLGNQAYKTSNHWHFYRVHLWGNEQTALVTAQLWPDPQIRLSVRTQAGGRHEIHGGSPWGWGTLAPCVIEHHKFLVKTIDERREMIMKYDRVREGAGSHFRSHYCPEDFFSGDQIRDSLQPWDGETLPRSQ